jgi:hypothetical protein
MTNATRVVGSLIALLVVAAACTTREQSVKTNPDRPLASTSASGALTTPAVSVASLPSPVASVAPPSDEPLIQEYRDLVRKPATKAELEAFVSAHPKLLTATARPYGPTIMWLLEFTDEDAALVLYRAGATFPDDALALAARGGLDAVVDVLLAKRSNANAADDWGLTPLHLAAKYGHVSTIRKLLAAGASPNSHASNDGFTPLHVAVQEREEEVISVLLAAHAEIEAKDGHGRTPLHWGPYAYTSQPKHIYRKIGEPHDTVFVDPGPAIGIKLLLDAGANINAVDDEGNTPLHEAALVGSVRGAEILVARGAKLNVKNKAGETPMSIAKESEHRRGVLKILKKHVH